MYEAGNDLEARSNMLDAAYYAGHAFTVSYVGYVHAIAHPLGGKYNIAHGLANATGTTSRKRTHKIDKF